MDIGTVVKVVQPDVTIPGETKSYDGSIGVIVEEGRLEADTGDLIYSVLVDDGEALRVLELYEDELEQGDEYELEEVLQNA